ncbi:MAG: ATP-dependent sacrificial sulfur transferase LarE [Myxococcaceae bacterium]|nr:ATP-dependent sacrificial sulfur transferase LarE [Myxococcaceae bacterium]
MLTPDRIEALCEQSKDRLAAARAAIRAKGSALVAFSGGVDSALVLKLALEELGDRAVALTAISASVAPAEKAEAARLAKLWGARHLQIDSKELDDPRYAQNPTNRCYFCKSELYAICEQKRAELGLAVVMDGFNADDRKDHRPGQKAAREREIYSPLADAQLTKDEVRAWSYRLGLPTWNKPAMPCLASRIPYGTAVTVERLRQIGGAEAALRRLGLKIFRVRFHEEIARIEVSAEEFPKFHDAQFREAALNAVKAQGFKFVVLDLEPFRSGRLNEAAGVVSKPEGAVALPVVAS